MQKKSTIVTYQPQHKEAFRALNLQWIEKYFRVEEKDLQQVDHPEDCLRDGGEIFFALVDGKAVGTCALYKVGEHSYELAKMAVHPSSQGLGIGDQLMIEAENWAKQKGATEVLILSNTILNPAISLYQKHGYKTVHLGSHPDYERCNIEMRKTL